MIPALPAALVLLAAAPGPRVAVVDVDAPDVMLGLGAQVTRAVLAEAAQQHLDVVTPEQVRAQLKPGPYEQLRACHGNVACAAQLLEGLGVDRAVLGQVGRTETHYTLKLWLFDLKKLEVVADVDRQVLIAARRFMKDVQQAVPPLLRGEREARGTLSVKVNVANAQVSLDGEFVGVAPLTLTLRPGKYQVRIERNKYLPLERYVSVEPNQTTAPAFSLLLKPGEVPDEAAVPALARKPAEGQGRPLAVSPATWVAGAVAVAAGGAGLYFGLTASAQDKALQQGFEPTTGAYQGTRAEALAAQQNALIANVAFGVAGAAAVATVILAVRDARAAPVQVAPAVGPGAAGVVLGGSF